MLPLLSLLALAHGSPPQAYQLVETPGQPTQLLAGTSFGIVLSDDDGASWKWVCEEAIGYGPSLLPVWAVAANGALLGGTFRGLFFSNDRGCTWASHPEFGELPDGGQGTGVSDLHVAGGVVFATSGKYGVVNRIWRSTSSGADWTRTPVASAGEFYTTVRTAPSRPQRVYAGAWWFRPTPTEALYVSDNGGDSFTRLDVSALLPMVSTADGGMAVARGSFYLYAVHPSDPDTLYAGLQQDEGGLLRSFVLKSIDQGQSWQLVLEVPEQLSSVVVSADGNTVWAATSGKLYRSTNAGGTFAPLDVPASRSCVARFGGNLYACGWYEVDGFAVAREQGGVEPLVPVLTWPQINAVQQCSPTSQVNTICAGLLPAQQASFPVLGDGGTGGTGGGDGAGGGTGNGSGGGGGATPPCHCSAGAAEVSLTLWLLLGRFASPHALRRRRVHR